MKKDRKITITDMITIRSYLIYIGNKSITDIICEAYREGEEYAKEDFLASVEITIKEVSRPLHIERPDGSEERGEDEYECI